MSRRTGQSEIRRGLNERREREADINDRIYVSPYGDRGLHKIKARADGQVYVASGVQKTFKPDTVVPAASHVGNQAETILIAPPPGKRGPAARATGDVVVPQQPTITGDFSRFAYTSSTQVQQKTFSVLGTNFSPSNTWEIFDLWDYLDTEPSAYTGPPITITATSYLSSTAFDISIYMPASHDVVFQFGVRSAVGGNIRIGTRADLLEWPDTSWADGAQPENGRFGFQGV